MQSRSKRKRNRSFGNWVVIGIVSIVVIFIAIYYIWQNTEQAGKPQEQTQAQTQTPAVPSQGKKGEVLSAVPTEQQVASADETWAQDKLAQMTIAEKAAQMMIVDTDTLPPQGNESMLDRLRANQFGGVIIFQRQLHSAQQTVQWVHEMKQTATQIPLWISIDQEGGMVTRLPWLPLYPGNMALGATRDTATAETIGRQIGEDIRSFGFNLNFAPDLDVNNNPSNPVIGIRSFGSDPQLVATMGTAMIKGLHASDMPIAVKHFPGHGDTETDSHLGLPSIPYDRARLDQVELVPFREAIKQGTDMIMTAHITYPNIEKRTVISHKDGQPVHLPATLSSYFLTDVLRKELNFQGVIVTDSLEMDAISKNFGKQEAVLMAIQAGADQLLMPPNPEQAVQWVVQAVQKGTITEGRLNESVLRILSLKHKYGLDQAEARLSYEALWQQAEARMKNQDIREVELRAAERAVTLLRNEGKVLPYRETTSFFVIAPNDLLGTVRGELQRQLQSMQRTADIVGYTLTGSLTPSQLSRIGAGAGVIIVTEDLNLDRRQRIAVQHIWSQLKAKQLPAAMLAAGSPYHIRYVPDISAYLALYGDRKTANIPAGIRVALGLVSPQGKLPVTIPDLQGNTLYAFGSESLDYP